MSEEPVKKRGRPKKVVATTEEASKSPKESGKASKEEAKKELRKTIESDVSEPKRRRIAKSSVDKENNAPKLDLKTETTPTPTSEVQRKPWLPLTAYENSKILQELVSKSSSNPSASPMLPTTARPNSPPIQLLSSSPLNMTASPILQQAAALSSNAKPTASSAPGTTSKSSSSAKTTTPRKAAATPSVKAVNTAPKSTSKVSKPATPSAKAATSSATPSTASQSPSKATSTASASAPKVISTPTIPPITASRTPSEPPIPLKQPPSTPTASLKRPTPPTTSHRAFSPSSGAINNPMSRDHPEYKKAFRRWSVIMAVTPLLIATSYILYQREILGKEGGFGGAEVGSVRAWMEKGRERFEMARGEGRALAERAANAVGAWGVGVKGEGQGQGVEGKEGAEVKDGKAAGE